MPQVCHKHCPPGGGGGGTAVLAVIAVLAVAAVARPVVHAAEVLLQVVLITCGVLAAGGVLTAVVVLTVRVRHNRALRASRAAVLASRPAAALPAPPKAIEAARVIPGQVIAGTPDFAKRKIT